MRQRKYEESILVAELSKTLTPVDILHECVILFIKKQPLSTIFFPLWLIRGKKYFTQKIYDNVELDVASLPYNSEIIEFIKHTKASGKEVALCTRTSEKIAKASAAHLGLFDHVIANLETPNEKNLYRGGALSARISGKSYHYIGHSKEDINLWSNSDGGILVNASKGTHKRVQRVTSILKTFAANRLQIFDFFELIRMQQWIKNMLLFVPFLAAHDIANPGKWEALFTAFLAFGLVASAGYLINDLADLEADRKHKLKCTRPFAAGRVPIAYACALVPVLLLAGAVTGAAINHGFLGCLLLYFMGTVTYSLVLKKIGLVDCFTLAGLYTLRIISGGVAVAITPSLWLLTFSIFIFLSLAFIKRFVEINAYDWGKEKVLTGRGYSKEDLEIIPIIGATSGCLSAVILALYLNSDAVRALYRFPEVVWVSVPLLLFWISRFWIKAVRKEIHADPIVSVLSDKVSITIILAILALFISAANWSIG